MYGMVWCGMVWYGMVWYGMVWYGMVWYGTEWFGVVWYERRQPYVIHITVPYLHVQFLLQPFSK